MEVKNEWFKLSCAGEDWQFVTNRSYIDAVDPILIDAYDLVTSEPLAGRGLEPVRFEVIEHSDDDHPQWVGTFRAGQALTGTGGYVLLLRGREHVERVSELLVPDCEILDGVDQHGNHLTVFHCVTSVEALDLERSKVRYRADGVRVAEVREPVLNLDVLEGHHCVRDARKRRSSPRYSPEVVALFEELGITGIEFLPANRW